MISVQLLSQNCGNTTVSAVQSIEMEINGTVSDKLINTYWHIVRTGSGQMNKDISFFETLIDETKTIFESHSILLGNCPSINYIDSDLLYNVDELGELCLFTDFCIDDALNVFLIESNSTQLGEGNIRGNKCFVKVENLAGGIPITCHEIGHCLGLFHTQGGRDMNEVNPTSGNNWKCDNQGAYNGAINNFTNCSDPTKPIKRHYPLELVD